MSLFYIFNGGVKLTIYLFYHFEKTGSKLYIILNEVVSLLPQRYIS